MKPCSCCGSGLIGEVVGIVWGAGDVPAGLAYQCPCGNTRAMLRADAPPELWQEAVAVEEQRRRA